MRNFLIILSIITFLFACNKSDEKNVSEITSEKLSENQMAIGKEVVNLNMGINFYEKVLNETTQRATLNLYAGATPINNSQRFTLSGNGSSISFSIYFDENIEGNYTFLNDITKISNLKFTAFYGNNYNLSLPTLDNMVQIKSGTLIIKKVSENYKINFDLIDSNNQTIKGNFLKAIQEIKDLNYYKSIITHKSWSPVSYKLNGVESIKDCMSDDVLKFNADGTYSNTANTACKDESDEKGTWTFDDQNILTMTEAGTSDAVGMNLDIIDRTQLKLSITNNNGGETPKKIEFVFN